MMTNELHLYVVETNPDRAKSLRAEVAELPQVTVLQDYADAVLTSGGLDAIFVPLMSALDWGVVKPPVSLHQTRVIKMPESEVARGRPQFAIPGVATSPNESLNPVETTRLILRESFKAIQQFNDASPVKLEKVGVAALSLGLEKLRSGEAMELLRDAYLSSPVS
jgi:hypothetical protein